MDAVFLARLQFGLTAGFHFLFPPTTLGLSLLILIMESLYLRTKNALYKDVSAYLVRILGVVFIMGVSTGIALEFAFGNNWAAYARTVGDVFGAPLAARTEYAGNFFTLFRSLPLIFGVLGLCAFLLHGSAYAALKTEGALQARARKSVKILVVATSIAFLLSFIVVWIYLPDATKMIPAWVFALIVGISLGSLMRSGKKATDKRTFLLSSLTFLGLWGVVVAIHHPNLVRAADPSLSLTIANASSSALTLKVMLIIALVGMPLVIGYTVFAYRVFKGKVGPDDAGY